MPVSDRSLILDHVALAPLSEATHDTTLTSVAAELGLRTIDPVSTHTDAD